MQKITHINLAKGFRGGERQTQILIEELSKKGYRQKLIGRKGSVLLKRCESIDNLEIVYILKPYIFSLQKLKSEKIIHAHETKALQLAFWANLFFDIPYIVTRRVDNKIKNNLFNKLLYKKASQVVALSSAIKNQIKKLNKEINVNIIPSAYTKPSLDDKKIKALKDRYKDKFIVGHVGALDDRHKGQSYLIKAAKMLEYEYPDIHFLFVGGGKDEKKLKELAKDVKNITFVGFVNDVHNYISVFDIFAFPSLNEGLGSILFDAMKLKVPIVASNVGGIPDIIEDEKNGLLFPPKDAKAIKDAILRVYKNEGLRKKLAENAFISIENFSSASMCQKYEDIYRSL